MVSTLTHLQSTPAKGNTRLASPIKALHAIFSRKVSGRLTIRDPQDTEIFWRVHVGRGKIHFASSTIGQQERLAYLLQWYCPELEPLPSDRFESDYQAICYHWQSGQLSWRHARKLLLLLTQEAFIHLLSLPEAELQFDKTVGLDPLLLSASPQEAIYPIREFVSHWRQLKSEIRSPFQRLSTKDMDRVAQMLPYPGEHDRFVESLGNCLQQRLCLYDIARELKTETLALATLLQPLVRAGVVQVSNYHTNYQHKRPVVACVDDSRTVQHYVKLSLEAAGYQTMSFTHPTTALKALQHRQPDMILMDICLPEMSGYELCRLLRQVPQLQDTPIVMLTGRSGLVDRVRSHFVGATEYITKPFKAERLLSVVEATLKPENSQPSKPASMSRMAVGMPA